MVTKFFTNLGSRENIPLVVAFAVVVAVVLAWLSPAEASLGEAVKLVYMHAALMWVAFGLLTVAAVLGLAYLGFRRPSLIAWSNGSVVAAIGLLLGTGLLGLLTAKVTWGGINWSEPRLTMLGQILLIGVAVIAVAKLSPSSALQAVANIFLGGVAWWLLFSTERVVHPDSPIFASDSIAIKVFPLLITASLAFAALQVVRYLVAGAEERRSAA